MDKAQQPCWWSAMSIRSGTISLIMLLGLWLTGIPAASAEQFMLIAKPSIHDRFFGRTVVFVTDHGGGGTVGVIINRPTGATLEEVLPDVAALRGNQEALYFGGPVQSQLLVFIVRAEQPLEGAIPLTDGIYLSFERPLLDQFLARDAPTSDLRLLRGYAGWASGQLAAEIARGDWIKTDVERDLVFDPDPRTVWSRAIKKHGGNWVQRRSPDAQNLAKVGEP